MPRRAEPIVDDDNPEWTESDFAAARPAHELPATILDQFPKTRRVRGAQRAPTKVQVAVRLSRDVVDRLKAEGPGWHRRIDELLRKSLRL